MDLSSILAHAPAPVAADWAVRTGTVPRTPVDLTPTQAVTYACARGSSLRPEDLDALLAPGRENVLEALLGCGDGQVVTATLGSPLVPHDVRVRYLRRSDRAHLPLTEARKLVAAEGTLEEITQTSSAEYIPVPRLGRLLLEGHSVEDLMTPAEFDRSAFRGYGAGDGSVDEVEAVIRAAQEREVALGAWRPEPEPVWEAMYRVMLDLVREPWGPLDESRAERMVELSCLLGTPSAWLKHSRPEGLAIPGPSHLDMDPSEYRYWLCSTWSHLFPLNVEDMVQCREHLDSGFLVEGTPEVVAHLAGDSSLLGRAELAALTATETETVEVLAEWVKGLDSGEWNLPNLAHALGKYVNADPIHEALKDHLWCLWEQGAQSNLQGNFPWESTLRTEMPELWEEFLRAGHTRYTGVELVDRTVGDGTTTQVKALAERLLSGDLPTGEAAAAAGHLLSRCRKLLSGAAWEDVGLPLLDLALSHPEGVKSFPWTRKALYAISQVDPALATRLVSMWVRRYTEDGTGPAPAGQPVSVWGTDEDVAVCLKLLTGRERDQFLDTLLRRRPAAAALLADVVAESLGSDVTAWGLLHSLAADWSGTLTELITTVKVLMAS